MRIVYFILLSVLTLHSCGDVKRGDLMDISVEISRNVTLLLSEITEEITSIELELTDKSIINPDDIRKVHFSDSLIFIAEMYKMLVFDMEGKFIRSIGSRGQGPGEYIFIQGFTFDEKNKIIYIINNYRQIIGYDLNGNFVKEFSLRDMVISGRNRGQILGIDYFDNELLLLAENIIGQQGKKHVIRSVLYKINNEMQFIDSCFVRDDYLEIIPSKGMLYDYATYSNTAVYLYYPEISSFIINNNPDLYNRLGTVERVLRDTLYRFENNRLVPELKLNFKRNGRDYNGDKNVELYNIHRSSRYIFVIYTTVLDRNSRFLFCYDTETGIGYNSLKYRDEFNNIEEEVRGNSLRRPIRPVSNNTELFYYWHTHMKPDDMNEPNPTLYIGRLKK